MKTCFKSVDIFSLLGLTRINEDVKDSDPVTIDTDRKTLKKIENANPDQTELLSWQLILLQKIRKPQHDKMYIKLLRKTDPIDLNYIKEITRSVNKDNLEKLNINIVSNIIETTIDKLPIRILKYLINKTPLPKNKQDSLSILDIVLFLLTHNKETWPASAEWIKNITLTWLELDLNKETPHQHEAIVDAIENALNLMVNVLKSSSASCPKEQNLPQLIANILNASSDHISAVEKMCLAILTVLHQIWSESRPLESIISMPDEKAERASISVKTKVADNAMYTTENVPPSPHEKKIDTPDKSGGAIPKSHPKPPLPAPSKSIPIYGENISSQKEFNELIVRCCLKMSQEMSDREAIIMDYIGDSESKAKRSSVLKAIIDGGWVDKKICELLRLVIEKTGDKDSTFIEIFDLFLLPENLKHGFPPMIAKEQGKTGPCLHKFYRTQENEDYFFALVDQIEPSEILESFRNHLFIMNNDFIIQLAIYMAFEVYFGETLFNKLITNGTGSTTTFYLSKTCSSSFNNRYNPLRSLLIGKKQKAQILTLGNLYRFEFKENSKAKNTSSIVAMCTKKTDKNEGIFTAPGLCINATEQQICNIIKELYLENSNNKTDPGRSTENVSCCQTLQEDPNVRSNPSKPLNDLKKQNDDNPVFIGTAPTETFTIDFRKLKDIKKSIMKEILNQSNMNKKQTKMTKKPVNKKTKMQPSMKEIKSTTANTLKTLKAQPSHRASEENTLLKKTPENSSSHYTPHSFLHARSTENSPANSMQLSGAIPKIRPKVAAPECSIYMEEGKDIKNQEEFNKLLVERTHALRKHMKDREDTILIFIKDPQNREKMASANRALQGGFWLHHKIKKLLHKVIECCEDKKLKCLLESLIKEPDAENIIIAPHNSKKNKKPYMEPLTKPSTHSSQIDTITPYVLSKGFSACKALEAFTKHFCILDNAWIHQIAIYETILAYFGKTLFEKLCRSGTKGSTLYLTSKVKEGFFLGNSPITNCSKKLFDHVPNKMTIGHFYLSALIKVPQNINSTCMIAFCTGIENGDALFTSPEMFEDVNERKASIEILNFFKSKFQYDVTAQKPLADLASTPPQPFISEGWVSENPVLRDSFEQLKYDSQSSHPYAENCIFPIGEAYIDFDILRRKKNEIIEEEKTQNFGTRAPKSNTKSKTSYRRKLKQKTPRNPDTPPKDFITSHPLKSPTTSHIPGSANSTGTKKYEKHEEHEEHEIDPSPFLTEPDLIFKLTDKTSNLTKLNRIYCQGKGKVDKKNIQQICREIRQLQQELNEKEISIEDPLKRHLKQALKKAQKINQSD